MPHIPLHHRRPKPRQEAVETVDIPLDGEALVALAEDVIEAVAMGILAGDVRATYRLSGCAGMLLATVTLGADDASVHEAIDKCRNEIAQTLADDPEDEGVE